MNTIAVVCGGYSKEEIISLKSAEQIVQSIDASLFKIYTILINNNNWVAKLESGNEPIDKNDFSFSENGIKISFDAVFMAIHGTPGEDGKLQSYFEMLNIPFTTCNTFVSALTSNKFACKLHLKEFGFLTAKSIVLRIGVKINQEEIIKSLGFPMFVKPNNGGSSFGVTKVKTNGELLPAIDKAFAEDSEIIIEEFIEGREFTCGVFKSTNEAIILPVTEIISKTEFFDFEAKYEGFADEITPAEISNKETEECQKLTSSIYDILACNGVVRIDFLQRNNEFYFMEVNTVPGMSAESIIPQQVKAHGFTITEFYSKLIHDAINRSNI